MEENEYIELEYENSTILQRKSDGYISTTHIAKICKKKVHDFLRLHQTRKFIEILQKELNIDKIVDITKGGDAKKQGTFMHPQLITYFAVWVSPYFAMKVSKWIEEWKKIKQENEIQYYKELCSLQKNENCLKEKKIQHILVEKLNGKMEIETKLGFIDVMTEEFIIEIKQVQNWKHALGQILCYSLEYPNKKRIICLFDTNTETLEFLKIIEESLKKYDIELMIYD